MDKNAEAGNYGEEQANSCRTAQLFQATKWKCEVCLGFGHEYWECPTKKKLDAYAAKNGEAHIWGCWKYYRYYKDIDTETRKKH